MPNLEFSPEELNVTREVIEHGVHEVELEISRADSLEFKQMLKRRRAILKSVVKKLADEPIRAAA